jgi:hypothetical protein
MGLENLQNKAHVVHARYCISLHKLCVEGEDDMFIEQV